MIRVLRLLVLIAAGVLASSAPGSAQRLIFATPSVAQTGFAETFSAMASPRSLRGGDLDPTKWSTARLTPDGVSVPRPNHVRPATIPSGIRSTFSGGTSVYPPDDTLIQDAAGARSARLMSAIVIQEYGHVGYMIRQPFDFASRTGTITADVDAWSQGILGTYITIDLTQDPVPATSFAIDQNQEPGPRAKDGLFIQWSGGADGTPNTIGAVLTYTNYTMTTVSPSFTVSGVDRPLVSPGKLNHIQIQVSTTHLVVYESDYSTDDVTFPNQRRIYEADISLAFSRGYVHIGARNHSTTKFMYPETSVYYWDNVTFDGPRLPTPRAYEIADNTVISHNSSPPEGLPEYNFTRLAWEVSDGSGRTQGLWDAADASAHRDPFAIPSVNISGITAATLTLNTFVNAVSHTATTSWGLLYRFNTGTWRTRLLTAAEVAMLNTDLGTAGYLALAIDVPTGDLTSGTNTLEFNTVAVPQDYAPTVFNIDLLVHAS